ncbi:MAG: hypothetical protein GDYSWBUE_001456 [Candidatus Fervidibacterota bacterium]
MHMPHIQFCHAAHELLFSLASLAALSSAAIVVHPFAHSISSALLWEGSKSWADHRPPLRVWADHSPPIFSR